MCYSYATGGLSVITRNLEVFVFEGAAVVAWSVESALQFK